MQPIPHPGSEPETRVLFETRLEPYSSLSPAGFRRLFTVLAIASLTIGTVLFVSGAWPVVGFLGLDVLLLWVALRASYRRTHEHVRLTERELVVERIAANGRVQRWVLQPNWLTVSLAEPVQHDSPVELRSHGRILRLGLVLAPEPRAAFAAALRRALARIREPVPAEA
jgi:uncharacterized membrane protein